MTIDIDQLMASTGASRTRAEAKLDTLNEAMAQYEINTPARVGMFLANVGHETMGLVYARELWGPTPTQLRYEGRADLGNTQPGDGKRYLGRGDLQTTGRANYRTLRDRLRQRGVECPDFEADPVQLESPEWAAYSAADYVDMRNLNARADRGAFVDYCIGINGKNKQGLPNGLDDRMRLWAAAQKVLA